MRSDTLGSMIDGVAPPAPLRAPLAGETLHLDDPRAGSLQLYAAGPSGSSPMLLVHSINAAASAYEVRPLYDRFSASRPTYALDLPGFGRSERSPRRYVPRLMTDAIHAAVAHVRGRHGGAKVDALAVSLSCEMLARAAVETPEAFRTLALVSPTGLAGKALDGPPGSTLGRDGVQAILGGWLGRASFSLLTRPSVIRYFLARTFGRKHIDEGLWAYAVETAHQPGAEHAPLWFLSGHLFSRDATRVYEALEPPVWACHGVRGDFVRYDDVDRLARQRGWTRTVLETGALPYFELPEAFVSAYEEHLGRGRPTKE